MKLPSLNQKFFVLCCLLFVVFLGGFLRFYNLNWDEGHFFHPDERNIALAVSRIHFFDNLNPEFFAYGSLPIYLYRTIGDTLVSLTQDKTWVSEWSKINLIGRGVSAFFSTISIILIFFVGKRIWDEKVGLLASILAAFTVSFIQTAHFGVTESLLVFWVLLLTFFSFKLIKAPTIKNYAKIGVILGLAIATKVSALSFLIIPASLQILFHLKAWKNHLKFLILALVALFTFSFFSPYFFLNQQKFFESINYETGVATGRLKVVYVLQFEKTWPYLFQIKNFFWQMGPVAIISLLGTLFLLFLAFKNKDKKLLIAKQQALLILLSFPMIYFLYVGSWYTKFIRYMVPVLPFLILFAAWFLILIQKRWPRLGTILISFTLLSTLFWAIAFFSIYTRPQTRITASRWIYQNIPPGAKILTEHWDDGLPVPLPSENPGKYEIEQLAIYEPDNQRKLEYYSDKLSQADYIIINSRRLYSTLIYLPEKYPITSRYYQLLFEGRLGYAKITEFSSYPEILGIKINDDSAEETFQVYDHPKVIIFKNTKRLSKEALIRNFQ